MNRCDEVATEYFNWMYRLVADEDTDKTYRKLFHALYDTDFVWSIPMDGNRADDGIELRYRFGCECGYPDAEIALFLDDIPCTMLEMMIALAIRCEEQIMGDPEFGNRTYQWFWEMVSSLGLSRMDDKHFKKKRVEEALTRFLNREYEQNGYGGLFAVRNADCDMRSIEIWYQLHRYLNEIM